MATLSTAAGRAFHENVVRRGGLEASEGCRDGALKERDENRVLAVTAGFQSRDADEQLSEEVYSKAIVPSEEELRLATEAAKANAEADSLQAEIALRAERQHLAWKERWARHVDRAVYDFVST